ncbi:MAG TPA: NUDIX hydrolase [Pseudomonadales bacterium]
MKPRFKTARCILYRGDEYLLAVHNRYWPRAERRWGLPGGQVEWGESARDAVARELEEELNLYVPHLIEVGAYTYKRAEHMVFAAEVEQDIDAFDTAELLDIGWFSEQDVARLHARAALHADYELDAIRRLRGRLERTSPIAAAG